MFDVFYQGPKPDLFPHEQLATDLDDAARRSRTKFFWYIDGANDYTNFNFDYTATPWEEQFIHVWPSQWCERSTTYLANKYTVADRNWHFKTDQQVKSKADMSRWIVPEYIDSAFDFSWHPDPLDADYVYHFSTQWHETGGPIYNPNGTAGVKLVDAPKASAVDTGIEIVYVDHGNTPNNLDALKQRYPQIRSTRFIESYLGTIKRIMNTVNKKHVWIVSSLCDYTDFDFTWHPTVWQQDMMHVFASDSEAKGDTFYVNVDVFKEQSKELELLDWLGAINYSTDQTVKRYPIPVVEFDGHDLVSVVKDHAFNHPYTLFTNRNISVLPTDYCVWSQKTRSVMPLTESGSVSLIPRDIKTHLEDQIYDYPFIFKQNNRVFGDKPLDIIYISNGEPDAERWYNHLLATVGAGNYTNWIRRVKNVNGRSQAYKAAAELSQTPWFFAVFAKLEVVDSFDWSWQPDYLQEPKHYIFNSRNPVNGLEYGHMGVIAYNRRLVLETEKPGLDFTLSKAHAVVPVLSAIAHYNTTPELTWRTAFREAIKLKDDIEKTGGVESRHRLFEWMMRENGAHGSWSVKGAQDAIEYYNEVAGNYDKLMLSFEWAWLQDYWASRYLQ